MVSRFSSSKNTFSLKHQSLIKAKIEAAKRVLQHGCIKCQTKEENVLKIAEENEIKKIESKEEKSERSEGVRAEL